jgi:hypothetical protein
MTRSATMLGLAGVAALAVSVGSATANNRHRDDVVRAFLVGSNEVPSVSTGASGRFRAEISDDEQSVEFTLTYEGLEGGSTLFAHIHLGERHTNGGVMVFLCGGATKPTPCPNPGGTVKGTLTAADVIGIATQQVPAGGFDEVIAALRAGLGYVNVHTTASPGGEIRGQLIPH